jgi:hypothetical protein
MTEQDLKLVRVERCRMVSMPKMRCSVSQQQHFALPFLGGHPCLPRALVPAPRMGQREEPGNTCI